MLHVELDADVPESRQITMILPSEVPTGRIRITMTVEPLATVSLPQYPIPWDDSRTDCYSGQVRITTGEDDE